jgi:alanine racemase
MMSARGQLHINLDAVTSNYVTLCQQLSDRTTCGACVKADAYGLGQEQIVRALNTAGCQDFFVAYVEGGIALRHILPEARIHVFSGLVGSAVDDFVHHNLNPILNSLDDIRIWSESGTSQAADIHLDTGMLRLGLPPDEFSVLANNLSLLDGMNIDVIMSHLSCAEVPGHPKNVEQLGAFTEIRKILPMGRASLANSSAIYLGPEYHFDLVRPGVALYGVNPTPYAITPMTQVVKLQGKILQVRSVDTPQTVGYGATHQVKGPGRIATVGTGYADGYLRFLSGCGTARVGEYLVPVVGPVSMDMITLDITQVPESLCLPGATVDLIGPHHDVDALATEAGTIGYEILTSMGQRHHRIYHGGDSNQ